MGDIFQDGITHSANSALRDFSGTCIKELVIWTIKQCEFSEAAGDPATIKALVKRIQTYSLHCDPNKRLGAALIFNNIYMILREEEKLMNIFWLEILYGFVMNLSLIKLSCSEDNNCSIQVNEAVEHVKRVLVEKHALFNSYDKARRIPPLFEGNCLKDVVLWLLGHINSRSLHCRQKCVELVCTLAPLVTGTNGLLSKFVDLYVPNRDEWITQICETTPFEKTPLLYETNCEDLFKKMEFFVCAIDGVIFLVDAELLPQDYNFETCGFFTSMQFFLDNVATNELKSVLSLFNENDRYSHSFSEKNIFCNLKSITVMQIIQLLTSLLKNDNYRFLVSQSFWEKTALSLICNLIFDPLILGFQAVSNQDKFRNPVLEFLKLANQNLPNIYSCIFQNIVCRHKIVKTKDVTSFKYRCFLKGLLLLQESIFDCKEFVSVCGTHLVADVFNCLITKDNSEICIVNTLSDVMSNYCDLVLQLACLRNVEFLSLIEHMYNQTAALIVESDKEVKCGQCFFDTFKSTIIKHILDKFNIFFKEVITASRPVGDTVIYLNQLLLYIQDHNKAINIEIQKNVTEQLLSNFNYFLPYFDQNYTTFEVGIEFIKRIAFVTANPVCFLGSSKSDLGNWIVNLLTKNLDLPLEVAFNFCIEVFELVIYITGPNEEDPLLR